MKKLLLVAAVGATAGIMLGVLFGLIGVSYWLLWAGYFVGIPAGAAMCAIERAGSGPRPESQ